MDRNSPSDSTSSHESEPKVALDVIPLHSSNLLTVLDETGLIQYESPSIERLFGFHQDELVGEQVAEYFHPADREEVLSAFRAVVEGDESAVESVQYRHEQADGSYNWVESVASGNPTPNGYYVVNTRDISAQKEREEQLEATIDRLDEFASLVSHDLRNPLSVAQGRLELLADEYESEHIAAIEQAHARIETLIDDLLTLSREGKQISELESVNLSELAESCWQTVPTADATLRTESDQQLLADRSRLRQLLENLIRNAVEHGGGDVTVTIGALDTGFYVEDDGSGLPETARNDMFAGGDSTTDGGNGFGLRIVKQVADAHGWEIHVTDDIESGTRFEFTGVRITKE